MSECKCTMAQSITGDDLKPYVYEFARELIALAQQIKPLDWVFLDHYQTWMSRGFDYDYIIPDAGDCYHLHYGDDVLCSSNSIDGLKKAAQQDYAKRVKSGLKYGGREMIHSCDDSQIMQALRKAMEPRKVQSPESTESCPHCGNTHLILLRTLYLKYCADCHTEITWRLEPGQKVLQ